MRSRFSFRATAVPRRNNRRQGSENGNGGFRRHPDQLRFQEYLDARPAAAISPIIRTMDGKPRFFGRRKKKKRSNIMRIPSGGATFHVSIVAPRPAALINGRM